MPTWIPFAQLVLLGVLVLLLLWIAFRRNGSDSLERNLRNDVQDSALDRLLAIAPALEAAGQPLMSDDAIAAEIDAARAQRRARKSLQQAGERANR